MSRAPSLSPAASGVPRSAIYEVQAVIAHETITVAYIDAGLPSRVLAEDWQIVVGYDRCRSARGSTSFHLVPMWRT